MTIATGLIASRFVHYLALCVLFGGAFFPFYAPAPETAGPQHGSPWLRPLLFGAAVLTLLSQLSWLGLTYAEAGTHPDIPISAARAAVAAVLAGLLFGKRMTTGRFKAVLLGALVLLASIALTGHSGSDTGQARIIHRILDVFHLVAAGIWIGALVVLAKLAMTAAQGFHGEDVRHFHDALARFSEIGPGVVIALALSGILNPAFLASFNTLYGEVLLTKLALFAAMLGLATANRYWLVPRLTAALGTERDANRAVGALYASVLVETALAVAIVMLVGVLGVLTPPGQ